MTIDLARFPREHLAHLPTPLEPLPRLSRELGGPSLWVKRDDCTGLGTGGNKTRKLEFVMADALAEGADTIITVNFAGFRIKEAPVTMRDRMSGQAMHNTLKGFYYMFKMFLSIYIVWLRRRTNLQALRPNVGE